MEKFPEKPNTMPLEGKDIEGVIADTKEGEWQKSLPKEIASDMVERFVGNDGKWHWRLLPEYIMDHETRLRIRQERKLWPRG